MNRYIIVDAERQINISSNERDVVIIIMITAIV